MTEDMNSIVCSYGCVATTDSQGVGTIRDLPSDELGKMLRLLQKQSEDKKEKTMKLGIDFDGNSALYKQEIFTAVKSKK